MGKLVIPVICALLLSSCAGTAGRTERAAQDGQASRPGWVDGVSADYPGARFLTGAASADDPETAKDRARGEISKIFSTRVTVNTYAAASEQTSTRQGSTVSSSSQDVAQTVRTTSQKMLEGVEIARTWWDPATGQHYALAVLERSKALAAMDARLSELDSRAVGLNRVFSAAAEKMEKAKCALELLALLKARQGFVTDIRVLNPGGAAEPGFDVNGILRDAAAALSALDVAVAISPENRGQVAAEIAKALNSLGIQAKTGGAGADMIVECTANFEAVADTDTRSRWKWYRGSASVSMKDVKAAKVFLSFNVSAKEAAASGKEALLKAETSLGKKIGVEISRGITSYFGNNANGLP